MIIWYNNSFLASLISIFSSVMIVLGVTEAINGEPSTLLIVIPGVAGVLLGKWISSRKAKKTAFKNWHAERGPECDEKVRTSGAFAAELYKAMPTAQMLDYIRSLNPRAAAAIQGKTAPAASAPAEPVYTPPAPERPAPSGPKQSADSGSMWSASPDL